MRAVVIALATCIATPAIAQDMGPLAPSPPNIDRAALCRALAEPYRDAMATGEVLNRGPASTGYEAPTPYVRDLIDHFHDVTPVVVKSYVRYGRVGLVVCHGTLFMSGGGQVSGKFSVQYSFAGPLYSWFPDR